MYKVYDSYSFLSNSVGSLVKTLVFNSHKKLKNLEKEIFEDVVILNTVIERETSTNNDRATVDF